MPSDDHQTPSQADRLSRKIDRLQTGQPSPVLDGDTEELADLARRLMEELAKDQPDPTFREQLKQDLINPGPRLVKLKPRYGPRRYPVPAFFGALTVVLVASAVTGWLVFSDIGGGDSDSLDDVAGFANASPTATAGALMATGTSVAIEANAQSTQAGTPIAGGLGRQDGGTGQPVATSKEDALMETAQAPINTDQRAVIDLPPVDHRHVELGALATIATSNVIEPQNIRYNSVSDPETVDLETESVAYEFSSPYVDAGLILRSVQDFLGIEANVEQRERAGRTIYSLSSAEGSVNFTWSPESGAFSCTLPDPYSTSEVEDLSEAAIKWLQSFGFPVSDEGVRPVIQTNEDGKTFVHVPIGDEQLPKPAVGHPMSITLVVDGEGRIVSVSGYWLEVTSENTVPLMSAATAWNVVTSGGGYWPHGTAPEGPGEFSAERFELSYMLTSAEQSGSGLVLQPVIAITGTFIPEDGTAYQTTVYVQGLASI